MAYLPGFAHDIYISYSHLNNGGDGWVSRFHSQLDAELKRLAGRDLSIWRDRQLELNQSFDLTIKTAIEGTGLLLALNSYTFRESVHCQHEVQWFCDKALKDGWGVSIGDSKRIFNVLLNNLPYNEWHPAFSNLLGFKFYEEFPDDDIGLACDPDSPEFKIQIRNLTRELFRTLRSFREAILNKRSAAPSPDVQNDSHQEPSNQGTPGISQQSQGGKLIFICYSRHDQEFALKSAQAIREAGLSVWIDQWSIRPGADWNVAIDTALAECHYFLIILSEAAVNSREERGELLTALETGSGKTIIPALYQKCAIPRQLRTIQHIDLTQGLTSNALEQLVRELKSR